MFNVILKQYYAGVTHPDHTCICCYNERLFEFYRLCYHKQLVSANSFFFLTKNNLRCTSKINRWHQNSNRFTMYKVLFWKYIITSYIKLKIRKWERIICIVHVVVPPPFRSTTQYYRSLCVTLLWADRKAAGFKMHKYAMAV